MSMTLHTVAAVRAQAYAEIIQVLKSLPSVKDVRVRVRAQYFGVDWAASEENDQDSYEGVLDRWHTKDKILMVKWDGWTRKPEPLGVEHKCTADAISGIMLFLEICEGAEVHSTQVGKVGCSILY